MYLLKKGRLKEAALLCLKWKCQTFYTEDSDDENWKLKDTSIMWISLKILVSNNWFGNVYYMTDFSKWERN